jgi:excinuclease ABC subunit C
MSARHVRNRVGSYFNGSPKSARIMSVISQIVRMDVTVTRSEAEALLLENQLIKSLSPRYNVSLRDDQDLSACAADPRGLAAHRLHRGPRAIPAATSGRIPASLRCARR